MTSTTKCPDCKFEAPYSGKGPHVVRCEPCRRAHLAAKTRAARAAQPREAVLPTVRERPPCGGCGAELPPAVGRGRHSLLCTACRAARRRLPASDGCVVCGGTLPAPSAGARPRLHCDGCRKARGNAAARAYKARTYVPRARVAARLPRQRSDGYVLVYRPDLPSSDKGYVLEHRAVMADLLGRPLRADENVHHISGERADNRASNLELWSTQQPPGQRVEDKVAWAKELLALYEPEALAPC